MQDFELDLDRALSQYVKHLVDQAVGHVEKLENAARRAADYGIGPDILSPPFNFDLCKVVHAKDPAKAADFAQKVTKEDPGDQWKRIAMFSDGSCRNSNRLSGSGVAYKLCHGRHSEWKTSSAVILGECDNNFAELTGINLALEIAANLLEEEKLHDGSGGATGCEEGSLSKVYIFSDSQAMLEWVDKHLKKEIIVKTDKVAKSLSHPAFREMARQLGRFSTLKAGLELHWVKGHYNIEGNTMADKLAGRATDRYFKKYGMPAKNQDYQVIPSSKEGNIETKTVQSTNHKRPPKRDAQAMLQESAEEPAGSHGEGHDISQRPILAPKRTATKPESISDDQVIEATPESSAKKAPVGSDEEEDHVPSKKPKLE